MENPFAALMMFALAGLSVILILIILLQRGRGGGLAGAFGGAGGQSALGTRAGDVFTKITVGLAIAWIVLACVSIFVLKAADSRFVEAADAGADPAVVVPPADADDAAVTPEDGSLEIPTPGAADPTLDEVDAEIDGDPAAAETDGDAEPVEAAGSEGADADALAAPDVDE